MGLCIDRQQQLSELRAADAGIQLVTQQLGIAAFAGDCRIVAQDHVSSGRDHQLPCRERRVQALAATADLGEHPFNERVRCRRQVMSLEKGTACRSPTQSRQ